MDKLFEDWIDHSKEVTFEDDLEVKLKYSCTYKIYDYKDLSIKNKRSKKFDPRVYFVDIHCEFKDYLPIARDIDPEAFNTIVGGVKEYYFHQYEVHIEPAVDLELWMLERDLDDQRYLDPGEYNEYYEEWEWRQKNHQNDPGIPFLKGFSTHISEYVHRVPREKIEALVKKKVKQLVSYFLIPQLKLSDNASGIYTFGSFVPDNYRHLERNRALAQMRKLEDSEKVIK